MVLLLDTFHKIVVFILFIYSKRLYFAKFLINYTVKLILKSCEKLCGGDIEVMQPWCSLFI